MNQRILGWDVGGANIKVALLADDRNAQPAIVERPFALWRNPRDLPAALAAAGERVAGSSSISAMAVTMTAELADCFGTKREGVACVLDAFGAAFPGVKCWIYGVDGRFRSVDEARRQPFDVAAANWRASAALVARTFADALFVDVGSTTTDIIPIVGSRVVVQGTTDPARLQSGELVYTGALRTPICAIVRSVPFRGRACRVAAEHFAIAADVYVWLKRLAEGDYTCETPDGRGRGRFDAGARIARVICGDLEMLNESDITGIAEHIAREQTRQIKSGIRQVVRRLGPAAPRDVILAGQGTFLARPAAEQLGLASRDLADEIGGAAARAAPAAAVACLLREMLDATNVYRAAR